MSHVFIVVKWYPYRDVAPDTYGAFTTLAQATKCVERQSNGRPGVWRTNTQWEYTDMCMTICMHTVQTPE